MLFLMDISTLEYLNPQKKMALSLSFGCSFYFRLHLVMSTTLVHRVFLACGSSVQMVTWG